jgi:hypothetical protein
LGLFKGRCKRFYGLGEESTPAPVAVEAITVKVTPKQKVSKNTPKQKALAKVEAKPKAKKDNA